MKLIIGFEYVSKEDSQENPGMTTLMWTSKRSLNVSVRRDKFHKAHFQEKYLRLIK